MKPDTAELDRLTSHANNLLAEHKYAKAAKLREALEFAQRAEAGFVKVWGAIILIPSAPKKHTSALRPP